jgi:hypothetical protein
MLTGLRRVQACPHAGDYFCSSVLVPVSIFRPHIRLMQSSNSSTVDLAMYHAGLFHKPFGPSRMSSIVLLTACAHGAAAMCKALSLFANKPA